MQNVSFTLFLTLFGFFSCNSYENRNRASYVETTENGYNIISTQNDSILIQISISGSGLVEKVSNLTKGGSQIIHYDQQSGYIIAKIIETPESKQTGLSYYFYNSNEGMAGVQEYLNDKPDGDGFLFYDGMNRVKKFVRYDSLGRLIFEREYSFDGKIIED